LDHSLLVISVILRSFVGNVFSWRSVPGFL